MPVQVILGAQYTGAIDMWSFGCMAAELFLGLPLFPGACEHDLLERIVEFFGLPPPHMLREGANVKKFFKKVPGEGPEDIEYRLRSKEEYERFNNVPVAKGMVFSTESLAWQLF